MSKRIAKRLELEVVEVVKVNTANTSAASETTVARGRGGAQILLRIVGAIYVLESVMVMELPPGRDVLLGRPFIVACGYNAEHGTVRRPDGTVVRVTGTNDDNRRLAFVSTEGEAINTTRPSIRDASLLTTAAHASDDLVADLSDGRSATGGDATVRLAMAASRQWDDGAAAVGDECEEGSIGNPDNIPDILAADVDAQMGDQEYSDKMAVACEGAGDKTAAHKSMTYQLIMRYPHVFKWKALPASKALTGEPVRIITTSDHPPGTRYNNTVKIPAHQAALSKFIQEGLAAGILMRCDEQTRFNSPPLFVVKTKEDGSQEFRVVFDFRALNKVTVPWAAIIPNVTETIEFLAANKYISKMDLTRAFYQMLLALIDRHKTAFRTSEGTFMFTRAPLGPMNMPSEFNARMASFFRDLQDIMRHFFDDLTVATNGQYEDHLRALTKVLDVCAENNVILSIDKCRFGQQEITVLGHRVSYQNITMADKSRQAIERLQAPTSRKELERTIGLFNYWRSSIWGYAEIARPLTALLGHGIAFHFTDEHRRAFETLRKLLCQAKGLGAPLAGKNTTYEIVTDASGRAIAGAVIQRVAKDGGKSETRILMFVSRVLTVSEQGYCTTDREMLAIVVTLRKAGRIVHGSPLTIITDHKPLEFMLASCEPLGQRRARWISEVQLFGAEFRYCAGKSPLMRMIDCLTRQPTAPLEELQHFTFMITNASRQALSDPLMGMQLAEIPRARVDGDVVPQQTRQRSGQSVLDPAAVHQAMLVAIGHSEASAMPVTRAQRRAVDGARASTAVGASGIASASGSVVRAGPTGDGESDDDKEGPGAGRGDSAVPTAVGPRIAAPHVGRAVPVVAICGVWHEEIFASTASMEAIRTGAVPSGLPSRIQDKVREDMNNYTM